MNKYRERIKKEAKARRLSMLRMLDKGKTLAEIGTLFGISAQRVHQLIQIERPPTVAPIAQGQQID